MRTSAENTTPQNANIVEQTNVSTPDAPRRARRPGEAVGNKKIREEKEKMAASILGETLTKELSELLADNPKLKDDVLEAAKKMANNPGAHLQILNDLEIFPALINAEHPEKFPMLNRAKEEFLNGKGKPVNAASDAELCLELLVKTHKKLAERKLQPVTELFLQEDMEFLEKNETFIFQQSLNEDPSERDQILELTQYAYYLLRLSKTIECDADYYLVHLKHAITEIMRDKSNIFDTKPKEKCRFHQHFSRVSEKLEGSVTKILEKEISKEAKKKELLEIIRTEKAYADYWRAISTNRAEFYLKDLSKAITRLENEKNAFPNEEAKLALISTLKALKKTLHERVEKQLNKVSRADLKELESARKIASEHLTMVKELCDPEADDVKKEFAISDCYDNCAKEPLGITILKILGVIAFAAIGAVVGSVVGALILHGVGGFPGAFVGAYTGAAWAATTIGVTATGASLGLGASAIGFFAPNTLKRRLYDVKKDALNAVHPSQKKKKGESKNEAGDFMEVYNSLLPETSLSH